MGKKRSDGAVPESEKNPRALVAVLIAAPDGSFTYADRQLMNLLGDSIENILNGKEWERAGSREPSDEVTVTTWLEKIQRQAPGECQSGSTTVVCGDGSKKHLQYIAFTLSDGNVLTVFEDLSEHRRIERLIRQGRDLLRSISDNMPDLIWAKDMEGRYLFVNKTMCEFLLDCTSPAKVVGKTDRYFAEKIRSAGHKHDFGEICADSDAVVHATGKAQKFDEYGFIKGKFVYLEVQKAPLLDQNGDMIGTVGCGRDITSRRRAEEDLRESEERYKAAIEHSNDGVGIVSGTRYFYVNRRYLEIFGYDSLEEILALPPFSTVHPDDRPRVMNVSMRRRLGEEVPSLYEFKGIRKNREVIYIQASVAAITYQGERASLAYLRDITEQKRAQEALREREETIRALINASSDATLSIDTDGTIITANETLAKRLGKPLAEVMGTCLYEHWPEDIARSRKAMMARMIQSKRPVSFEDQHDGLVYENRLYPILDSGGNVAKAAIFSRDITESRRSESKLRESVDKLNALLRQTIQAMSVTVEARDPYTAGHQKRVAGFAVKIAREMNLPDDTVECVRIAGTIHDIGKLSVPAEILSKPSHLKDVEMAIMQIHAESGYEILKEIAFPWPIADIVHQHHERLDGSGYPMGLKGDEVLLEARILAVADVVESMISHRPYRPAHPIRVAVEEIERGRDTLYDPDVADACLRILEREGFDME